MQISDLLKTRRFECQNRTRILDLVGKPSITPTYKASCWCYKTFFGGNLDFPKIRILITFVLMIESEQKRTKQCYFQLNYIETLFICCKRVYSCCFSLGGNLDSLDFLQKSFITSTTTKCLNHKFVVNCDDDESLVRNGETKIEYREM